ncbi:MAG: CPBP family intramembrane glutamic endopeptidase, partial [Acidobacteriota bacterium]
MAVNWIFFDQTLRLRSGWRFAVFCVAFVFAAMIIGVAVAVLLSSLSVPLEPGSATYFLANSSPMLVPAMLVGWLCGKYLEALPFRALGASFTKGWLRHLLAGILFGAGTVSVAVLIAFVFGGLRFESNVIDGRMLAGSLTIAFMVFAVGAAAEEALFRGYILQTFARSGFAALAIALTAVFFGIVHSRNPNVG